MENEVREKGKHQDNNDQKRDDRKRVKQGFLVFEMHVVQGDEQGLDHRGREDHKERRGFRQNQAGYNREGYKDHEPYPHENVIDAVPFSHHDASSSKVKEREEKNPDDIDKVPV